MSTNGLATWKPFTPSVFDVFDDFFNDRFSTIKDYSSKEWVFKKSDTGGTLTVNALGHNPDDIEVELNNSKLTIKSTKPENGPPLMSDLNLSFTIPSQYSEKDIKANFNNGLVTIEFGMKEEAKPKKIKISY